MAELTPRRQAGATCPSGSAIIQARKPSAT